MENKTLRYQLTDVENMLVGAFAGTLETALQMPLLTWKFCKQEGRAYPKTVSGWYRGLAVQAGSLAPITAFQVTINGVLERATTGGTRNLTDLEQIRNAMVAGSLSSVIYGPADLIMIHQQKLKLNPINAVKHLSQQYGASCLYRGVVSTAIRESMYVGGALGITPVATRILMKQTDLTEVQSALIGSTLGGIIGSLLSHPVDTAKTTIQADINGEVYANARIAGMKYYEANGIRALYLGGLARTIRACGAFFVLYNVRESMINYRQNQPMN